MFSNFIIEYRPDENSNWSAALDINDQELASGVWDTGIYDQSIMGYTSALMYRGKVKPQYCRVVSPNLGYRDGSSGTDYKEGSNSGMINPNVYKEEEGNGLVKSDKSSDTFVGSSDYDWKVKSGRASGNGFAAGLALRNYANGSPEQSQAYLELTFAVDKVGDYRFCFDNLRQGINDGPEANLNAGAKGARPYIVAAQFGNSRTNQYIKTIGPGVCVQVLDMYNERPDKGIWGRYAPTPNFDSITLKDGSIQPNHKFEPLQKPADYTWYAYTVAENGYLTRAEALDANNWDPENEQYRYLFAKEPCFRYVKRFYTRIKVGGNYIYSPWLGGNSNQWFAFTKRYVSGNNNTIPSASAVGTSGTFLFPEQAGVPYGDEKAFGPTISSTGGGLYSTWCVQVQGNDGGFITKPIPTSYLDIYDSQPSWYTNSDDWSKGPNQNTPQTPDAP